MALIAIDTMTGTMTTIIGLEYADSCIIVADSRVTDDAGYIYTHPDIKKITFKCFFDQQKQLVIRKYFTLNRVLIKQQFKLSSKLQAKTISNQLTNGG
jgi:hypothetical protein